MGWDGSMGLMSDGVMDDGHENGLLNVMRLTSHRRSLHSESLIARRYKHIDVLRMQVLIFALMTMCTSTLAFGVVRRLASAPARSVRRMASVSNAQKLCGIDFVQKTVVDVLNDVFDPKEIARANALAKLDKGNKKKQKKPKKGEDTPPPTEPIEPSMSDEEKKALADAAASEARPFGLSDAMVTPATRPEFGDYQVNAAMGLANAVGMNPRYV